MAAKPTTRNPESMTTSPAPDRTLDLTFDPARISAPPNVAERRGQWQLPIRAVAWLIGFLLFYPALGIPFGGRWIQPLDLVAVPALLVAVPSLLQVRGRALLPIVVTMLSWAGSVLMAREPAGQIEVLFYAAALGPILLCTTSFLDRSEGRRAFLSGFLIGAIPSSALAVVQGLVGSSSVLDVRTNASFNLLPQPGRSMAFFPEASGFAATTAIHAACLILYRLTVDKEASGNTPSKDTSTNNTSTNNTSTNNTSTNNTEQTKRSLLYRFTPALLLLDLLGIAFAKSTSTLLLTPILLLLGFRLLGYSAPKMLKRLLLVGPIVAFMGYLFIAEFYSTRFANRDAFNSIETRLSTILAAVGPLREGQLFGVGVGNNELAESYILEASRERGLRAAVTSGITSLLGQRIFEEGIGAVISVGISVMVLWRNMMNRATSVERVLALFAGGMLLSFVFVSGYRGLYTSWMWIPVAGAFWSTGGLQNRPAHPSGVFDEQPTVDGQDGAGHIA